MKTPLPFLPLLLAALVAGCGGHGSSQQASGADLPAARVRLAPVRSAQLPLPSQSMGTVRPLRSAQVSARVMGTIEEMPVALGQHVRAGDLLVKISAEEIAAKVGQAQAQLSAARRDLDRETALLAKGASTADLVKGLQDRFDGAQAMVREAEVMQGYATLRAPFDGVVARKLADVGDLAAPGQPVLVIESSGAFQVEVPLPDSVAAGLAPGAELDVTLASAGHSFRGRLLEVSSSADAGSHTVLAKIAVPAEVAARSGEFARVAVAGSPVAALLVPTSAVSVTGQMQRVFVVGEGARAVMRLVRTGAVHGEETEILSGLEANERVVVAPPATLREGQALEIQP